MILYPTELSPIEKQYWLNYAVAPRPICFASTISASGGVNLSPFSYFNLFSTSPAVVIFSVTRRMKDGSSKDTLQNLQEVPELVINLVNDSMVQAMNLSSANYPREVNEFTKAGFTAIPAQMVRPPMVKESLIRLECRVMEIKSLGENAGAGQLVIAEVICLHFEKDLLTEEGKVDATKMDLIARGGEDYYYRANLASQFSVPRPPAIPGMGIDALPDSIRKSEVLTGNQLALLASVSDIPEVNPAFVDKHLQQIIQYFSINPTEMEQEVHRLAADWLQKGNAEAAWQVLLTTL
jgi:flavin reductase (DIM6/NTAB) family NADH-FMN oxidoreductase RutF